MSANHVASSHSMSNSKIKAPDNSPHDHSDNSSSQVKSFEHRRGFMGSQSNIFNYIGTSHIQGNLSQNNNSMISEDAVAVFIQGTSLDLNDLRVKVKEFLTGFKLNRTLDEDWEAMSYYMSGLQQVKDTDTYSLIVSAEHVYQFDPDLYYKLVWYPPEVISLFDKIVNETFRDNFVSDHLKPGFDKVILTTFVNLKKVSSIREIDYREINHLICLRGLVIRVSDIYPEMKMPCFRCTACGNKVSETIERGRIREPAQCGKCSNRHAFELVHNLCLFTDKQFIKLQEIQDRVPEGELPTHVNLVVYDDMVDCCKPGDAVEIVGIFRAMPVRVNRFQSTMRAVFRSYIDVVSITYIQENKVVIDSESSWDREKIQFSAKEVEEFRELAASPQIYDALSHALAPSIWELEDVKKGLLCQLFGGTSKGFDPAFKSRFRNELNVLLVGDPSTAKSQLLQAVHKVAPRGVYTSGKGSSAVGLTAYISTDPETKELVLESGALVLSDMGICCIDEFDKMNEGTSGILHEAMEQQTISIAKAGIVCSLNARTAVLAAANPKESRYNPKRSIVYNLRLPPSILSRFDLIYLMLDKVSDQADSKLAQHILALYSPSPPMPQHKTISQNFLTKYLSYARINCSPTLTPEACKEAVNGYIEMRKQGFSRNTITATPRQLESILRIAESLAKMRLSSEVICQDVNEAIRLVKEATQRAAIDPATGQIDMNMIATGYGSGMRHRINLCFEEIKKRLVSQEELFKRGIFASELRKDVSMTLMNRGATLEDITSEEMYEAVKMLEDEKKINIIGDQRGESFVIKLLKLD